MTNVCSSTSRTSTPISVIFTWCRFRSSADTGSEQRDDRGWDQHHRSPASSLGGEAQDLPRHRIDLDEICRDLLIAAALSGDRTEATAREPLRRTCAAEMNYRGELLRLLPAGRSFWPVREDCRSVAVQKHRRQLDGAARWDPRIEPG